MSPQRLVWIKRRVLFAHSAEYACALVFLLAGCATFDPRAGFEDVSAAVEARSAKRVVWNLGTDLDAQVTRDVQALLAVVISM